MDYANITNVTGYIMKIITEGGASVMANIYDIAKEANVSSATVSRVLNNKASVSPRTRQKVEEVIRRMNYQPNGLARGLVSKRTPTVGILTIDIRIPHYASTAFAMERELFKLGYSSILCNTGGGLDNNIEYLHMLVDKGVSGIMCIGSVFRDTFQDTSVLSEFHNIPFLFSNCVLQADNAYSVIIDEKSALNACVAHLVQKGNLDILYVKDAETFSGRKKAEGFLSAMTLAGLKSEDSLVFNTRRGISGGKDVVMRILESGQRFSAIIFGDDATAVGGMKELQRRGYKVPEDVAIVGFNNSVASISCTPTLTTVDNKTDTMGSFCVKLFQTVLEGGQLTKLLSVTPELIIRDST